MNCGPSAISRVSTKRRTGETAAEDGKARRGSVEGGLQLSTWVIEAAFTERRTLTCLTMKQTFGR
jgi:hypothetical protein